MMRKKYSRRRYRRNKRRYYQKKKDPKKSKFAYAVRRVLNYNSELKFIDQNTTAQAGGLPLLPWTTAQFTDLNMLVGITQGVGKQQRVGTRIKLVELAIRWHSEIQDGLGTDDSNIIRFVLFQWRDESTSFTNVNQLLKSYSTAGPTVTSMYNSTNAGQFRVIMDKTISLSRNGSKVKVGSKIAKKLDKNITYSDTSGLPTSGEFFLIYLSDSGVPLHPVLTLELRLKYNDI